VKHFLKYCGLLMEMGLSYFDIRASATHVSALPVPLRLILPAPTSSTPQKLLNHLRISSLLHDGGACNDSHHLPHVQPQQDNTTNIVADKQYDVNLLTINH
jgi:hypothetical protein